MVWPFPRSSDAVSAGTRELEREAMVCEQLRARNIVDPCVLAAMRNVPRHEFVGVARQGEAYADHPVPIGWGQTISQPYIVALIAQAARLQPDERVLEIGAGCGYQAAVLSRLSAEVRSLEIVPDLADRAAHTCARLGYTNIFIAVGDGYAGWPQYAPFDVIVIAAAPREVPQPLVEQLSLKGRLIAPVGDHEQMLACFRRTPSGIAREDIIPVRFVPMTGRAAER